MERLPMFTESEWRMLEERAQEVLLNEDPFSSVLAILVGQELLIRQRDTLVNP